VLRSRCRRLLRELYRLNVGKELAGMSVDVVVNARRGCERAPWRVLEQEFLACLRVVRLRLGGS